MGQGKGGSKRSRQIHFSAQLLLVTTWKRAMREGELGTIWSPENGEGDGKGGKGGKEAAAPPRHLTPTWGWFGPIPCTRARSSFGTGPICPGKTGQGGGGRARACPCGTCLWGPQPLLHCRAPSPFHPLSRDMESA